MKKINERTCGFPAVERQGYIICVGKVDVNVSL